MVSKKNIDDMIKAVKANPGKYTFGSSGKGSVGPVISRVLFKELGLDIKIVPYKGGGKTRKAFIAGEVNMTAAGSGGALKAKDQSVVLGAFMDGEVPGWESAEPINKLLKKYGYKNFIAILLGSDQGRKIYKKKLIRLIERFRLNNEVIFLEHAPSMPVAYSVSSVIVSASIEPEAFGRISVEAQSMKKPIVASDIGGSRETIVDNKTGLLFTSSDHHSLSEKLDFIFRLDDTSLNVMGNNGRKNVQKKFNVEKMCFSTYSEYKKLINA